MRITNSSIKNLKYGKSGKGADYRWDDTLKGFGIRIYPTGQVAFVTSYRNAAARKRIMVIGKPTEMSATIAREHARETLTNVRKGIDPADQRHAKRTEVTLSEFSELYLDHAKAHKKSWKDDEQRLRDHIKPYLCNKRLSEINPAELNQIHRRVKDIRTPATANRCAALMKHMFNLAVEWNYLSTSPAKHIKLFQEPPPPDIVLSPKDCGLLIEACDKDRNIFAGALFKLAMFTGRRIGELLNARWTDVNLEAGLLVLSDTKAGERQHVYLNEIALEVLSHLPRLVGNPYLIVGDVPGKPLNYYRRAWKRIIHRAGIDYIPVHGLRHNYASTLVAAGVPILQVGHLLGHKSGESTQRYAHPRPDDLLRAANTFGQVIDLLEKREERKLP